MAWNTLPEPPACRQPEDASHVVVHSDEFAYCAHPHLVTGKDGNWVAVFNIAPRKSFILHPPEEPLYRNVVIRSRDQGATWTAPEVVPDYTLSGTECAGLTVLADGRIMLNQWQFRWLPLSVARSMADQRGLTYPETFMRGWMASPEHAVHGFAERSIQQIPWVRAGGRTLVHFSGDNGRSFSGGVEIPTSPFSGGYGMRGGVQLPNGRIILPFSDVPYYKSVFVVASDDGGSTWSPPRLVAQGEDHEFEEPTLVRCRSGKLVMVMRDNASRWLHQIVSLDDGETWSEPEILPISGYPAHLLVLEDGRILMTYGWRQPDYGIRGVFSSDEGASWDIAATVSVRQGLPSKNAGYPVTVDFGDGFFTLYYGEDSRGITAILGTYWKDRPATKR